MTIVASLDFFTKLSVEKAILNSKFCIFLYKLFNFTLIKFRSSVILKNGVFILITSIVELWSHFSKFISFSHDFIVIDGELFNFIRVSFRVEKSN